MKMTSVVGGMASVLVWAAVSAVAEPVTPAVAKQNLDRVPATDPAPAAVPQLLSAVRNSHPRLLFTKAEIAQLKTQIPGDPILKKTYEDNASWAKKFNLAKAWQPTAIFRDDTPAITMVKSWPGLAYVYALDRDPAVKQTIVDILTMMLKEPYWADTAEFDSNMGAGENMLMAGLLFDAVCEDLEPEFRARVAACIFTHARRMYYLGHKELCTMPIKYWQQDPQNNHRWHRDAGLTACLLAVADEKGLDTGFMLEQLRKEMDFVVKWFPPEGDCHEGAGYQTFGFFYLAAAASMMDRNLGTAYLSHPGFKNAWAQQYYYAAPGRTGNMSFGDDMNGDGGAFDNQEAAFFIGPRLSRDRNVQAALVQRFLKKARFPNAPSRPYAYPWALLAFYDPTVGQGDAKALPLWRVFPDLGAVSLRDSWEDRAVCFTFKCGPYGGYRLNEYAHANPKDGKPHYINVAHDDPDANEFALGMDGAFLFHPGFYSLRKLTESHNTVSVDGKGQVNEGNDFTQPVPDTDMRTLSFLTGLKAGGNGRVIVEGEAGAAYRDKALKGFRRTAVWMPGDYILLLDDLRGNGVHNFMWRGIVEKGQFDNPAEGRCHAYTRSGRRVDFQILATRDFTGAIEHQFLDGRFGSALVQQFKFALDAETVKFACLLDPWQRKLSMTLREDGDTVTVTVRSDSFTDTWTWKGAQNATTPSALSGRRGATPLLSLTEADTVTHTATKAE